MTLRNRNILFTINESDVHEPADSDACIVFRKANHENPSAESHASTAEQFIKQCHLHSGPDSDDQPDVDGSNDDDTDETGIEPNLKFHLVPNTAGSHEVAWHSTAIHWTWSDETIKDPNRDACLTADGVSEPDHRIRPRKDDGNTKMCAPGSCCGTCVNTTPQMTRFRGAKVCSTWLQERSNDHNIQSDNKYKSGLKARIQ